MNLFHQTGFRINWNIESILDDKAGDGLILSPINIKYEKLLKIEPDLLSKSIFDPQLYIINDNKGKLVTYDYFPENIKDKYSTSDFEDYANIIAQKCIDLQISLNLQSLVIPTRYFDSWPSNYYNDHFHYIIEPFLNYIENKNIKKDTLLTLIVKHNQLYDEVKKNELLNWVTGLPNISGVYLIFENNFTTKQIKDTEYLFQVLLFIHFLKQNGLEVHIGYCNTEGFLYTVANPDSITMGSYENLRRFNVKRFITPEGDTRQSGPRARIYSSTLLQWIEYGYLGAFKRSYYSKLETIFEDSQYKPLMFEPEYNWNFQKSEPYKHFFTTFSNQINTLINSKDRTKFITESLLSAIDYFKDISNCGIVLDENSDGSHLSFWLSSLNMFEDHLRKAGL